MSILSEANGIRRVDIAIEFRDMHEFHSDHMFSVGTFPLSRTFYGSSVSEAVNALMESQNLTASDFKSVKFVAGHASSSLPASIVTGSWQDSVFYEMTLYSGNNPVNCVAIARMASEFCSEFKGYVPFQDPSKDTKTKDRIVKQLLKQYMAGDESTTDDHVTVAVRRASRLIDMGFDWPELYTIARRERISESYALSKRPTVSLSFNKTADKVLFMSSRDSNGAQSATNLAGSPDEIARIWLINGNINDIATVTFRTNSAVASVRGRFECPADGFSIHHTLTKMILNFYMSNVNSLDLDSVMELATDSSRTLVRLGLSDEQFNPRAALSDESAIKDFAMKKILKSVSQSKLMDSKWLCHVARFHGYDWPELDVIERSLEAGI